MAAEPVMPAATNLETAITPLQANAAITTLTELPPGIVLLRPNQARALTARPWVLHHAQRHDHCLYLPTRGASGATWGTRCIGAPLVCGSTYCRCCRGP